MILVNCVWEQESIKSHVENVLINGEKIFKLVKTEGMRMFFDSKIEDNSKSMKLIKKAIRQIEGYEALVINVVPVIDGSVFKGYIETACKTVGSSRKKTK